LLLNCLQDNTNEANLELYSVLGELDNAGFPLAYCLLSTATAISQCKRTATLISFLGKIRSTYHIFPSFTHVDKDFAEISALGAVWPSAKPQICMWHLQRAISERLAKPSLKTTSYNVAAARAEFGFIDSNFRVTTKPDPLDNEEYGYGPDEEYIPRRSKKGAKVVKKAPIPPPLPTHLLSQANPNTLFIKISIPSTSRTFSTQKPPLETDHQTDGGGSSNDESDDKSGTLGSRHQFCPADLREAVLSLVTMHFCVHPSIPGYAAPSREGIRWWAVQQMYNFCVKHDLKELWAYLWSNWYREDRWKLWARSMCKEIPRLRTTMICEAQ